MINILEATIGKEESLDIGTGALYSLVAILMVFVILLIIIGITSLVFKINGLFDMKKAIDASKASNEASVSKVANEPKEVNITDDDMMAAVLVATIDYRNEIKKDVRVVSVKEVK